MKRVFFLCLLPFLLITPLYAQEEEGATQPGADEEQTVFYISGVVYQITGRTRAWAASHIAEINEGERIAGKTKLDTYIRNKEQILLNTRVVESARIAYTMGEPEESGEIPVHLVVEIVDTMNIIALPEPKYSTSGGLDLELKIRDYNFLGTMSPLRLNIGYTLDEDHWKGGKGIEQPWDEGSITFSIDSDTPFKFMEFHWNFNFDHDFAYTLGEPLYYKNTTGVSMDIPWRRTIIT
ncbi:MAG: hypothetical protein LBH85_03145, partial [Treponema sp.]|nr:hypothetical protein [Treponema sp.]